MPEHRLLAPNQIAKELFLVDPDRDERASQVCMETLLSLAANDFSAPDGSPKSPKLRQFAVRSLVLGVNFLAGQDGYVGDSSMTAHDYGEHLKEARDFNSSDNLGLARTALRNLIDPSTQQGKEGQHLLLPFHRSLLWYDARLSATYTVRKVRMRGSGITLARMLLDPPGSLDGWERALAGRAVDAIREALAQESPLAEIADALEAVLPRSSSDPALEDDELQAWALGGEDSMSVFAGALARHACGVMSQSGASSAERLWQLRTILAMDLAIHALKRAWDRVETDPSARTLLFAWAGPDRQEDSVRLRSERSFSACRATIRWATISTLAGRMRSLAADPAIDWQDQFERRSGLQESVIDPLRAGGARADFTNLAQLAFESANYDRSGDGFRVLLDSIGMLAGGTRYRYMSATPDLLAALVGALSSEMPMTSLQFFRRLREEWGIVISPEAAVGSQLYGDLDGADLVANAQRCERALVRSGLASSHSDRTVLIGERTREGIG